MHTIELFTYKSAVFNTRITLPVSERKLVKMLRNDKNFFRERREMDLPISSSLVRVLGDIASIWGYSFVNKWVISSLVISRIRDFEYGITVETP